MPLINADQRSANTLTQKLSVYFASIAILVAALLFIFSQTVLYWLEDELNRRILEQSATPAMVQFIKGETPPLIIANNITAYNNPDELPSKYKYLSNYPLGFLDEISHDGKDELFIYRTEYLHHDKIIPLLLIMDAEQAELSESEWRNINLISILVMFLLFILFGYAIAKLTSRLITPIKQLSKQLKSDKAGLPFTVSSSSVTEFKELASSLNYYRSQNELLIRQEQAFAKYASHELRTPLTIIQGATKLLELEGNATFNNRQRTRIAKATTDMNHTIEALLSLVKHERENDSHISRILQRAEIEQTIEYLQPLADSKSITIELIVVAEPKIHPNIAVVRMLLSNLLQNSINASDSGVITIEVQANCIQVIDEGRGLNDTEQSKDGHGLGLLIVDAICDRYAWKLSLLPGSKSGCIAKLDFPSCHEIVH
ncbi:two-component sensor histidine kinase [Shewanella hanedai]|uniref:histidine kinase n=1 Tax=Shewanella hanedai TaxID=25 RepID=A0A553JTW1_SHEHA|nr:HAMP domain-containing sensor histidine kinase [Shewanella hanedai]TRY15881.1 HAMP domain-containing histidine kinase [Shewanella hanedai]GGI69747.1 two-component sensor histidine kinase [Shewanella hanedai]